MKKSQIFKFFLGVVVLTLVLGTMIATAGASAFGIGVLLATGTAVAGTVDTPAVNEASPELNRPDISQVVSKIRPDDVPLDTMLREIGAGDKAEAWKIEFYENTTRSIEDSLTSQYTTSGTYGTGDLPVSNVNNWSVDDIVYAPSIYAVGSSGAKLRMQVVDKNTSANTIKVIALNGTLNTSTNLTIIPTIASATPIYCIGNAKDEKAAQTTANQMIPGKTYNYCQIHMAQVEESVYEMMNLKEVPYGMVDYKADSIYEMRLKTELTSLFGRKSYSYDPISGKMKYFSGGIQEFAGKSVTYTKGQSSTDPLSANKFIDIAEYMFADNNGSSNRAFLVGSKLMAELMKVPTILKQVEAGNTEIKFGVKFNVIDTSFGQFYLKLDKALNLVGHSYDGFIIDVNKIRRRERIGMNWKKLMLEEAGISKVNAWRLEDCFGLEIRNPGCHAFVQGL